ncbi:hypothetical protein [Corynebacterium hindlerae]|uniref:hypothetical protein n=1 Tax=Corynebacterium hindlerae TaxID=699041 RepID=UPI003AB0D28F
MTSVQYDRIGRAVGTEGVEFRAVVVPESTETIRNEDAGVVATVPTKARLLVPYGWDLPPEVEEGAEIEVHSSTWYVDGEVVRYMSPFGTRVGGAEIKLSKTRVGGDYP